MKPLVWEETHTRRSNEDPATELTGFESETAFGTFYVIEVGAALFHLRYDYTSLGEFDTEREAKAAGDVHNANRILTRPRTHPASTDAVRRRGAGLAAYRGTAPHRRQTSCSRGSIGRSRACGEWRPAWPLGGGAMRLRLPMSRHGGAYPPQPLRTPALSTPPAGAAALNEEEGEVRSNLQRP